MWRTLWHNKSGFGFGEQGGRFCSVARCCRLIRNAPLSKSCAKLTIELWASCGFLFTAEQFSILCQSMSPILQSREAWNRVTFPRFFFEGCFERLTKIPWLGRPFLPGRRWLSPLGSKKTRSNVKRWSLFSIKKRFLHFARGFSGAVSTTWMTAPLPGDGSSCWTFMTSCSRLLASWGTDWQLVESWRTFGW